MNVEYLGNKELLEVQKTAFLASSTISSESVLRCYDWATEMRRRGECVISGFSSKLEKDVLHFLLKGTQPIIIVLARKMYKVIPKELQAPMEQNRLLIISVSNAARLKKHSFGTQQVHLRDIRPDFVCRSNGTKQSQFPKNNF